MTMKLTQSQLEQKLSNPLNRKFNLIILGMSGSGKTHWSRLLSQRYGYPHIEFDHLIGSSKEFTDLIQNMPGRDAAEKMGNYFGLPWSEGFQVKEAAYLEIERKFMSEFHAKGSILDMTGSCIYHLNEMDVIRATGLTIYLETSQEKQMEMLEIFIKHPKPVCWQGIFERKSDETNQQALSRCYPLLIAYRTRLYAQFADVILHHEIHKKIQSADGLVYEIMRQLPLHP